MKKARMPEPGTSHDPRKRSPGNKHAVLLRNMQNTIPHILFKNIPHGLPRKILQGGHAGQGKDIVHQILHIGHFQRVPVQQLPHFREDRPQDLSAVLKGEMMIEGIPRPFIRKQAADIFHDAVFTVCGAVEGSAAFQDAPDLTEPSGEIRHVIKHHIGDDNIKLTIRKRDLLDVDDAVFDVSRTAERLFRFFQHSFG